ncbi:MTERF6 [Symbiodinium sp. CCMP2456]|nr:MTERF6 [Symbiodinium sp. CCMP2456]
MSWRYFRASTWLLHCFTLGLAACGPPWWRKGRPRTTHRSYAEVELLSRLAELLMPGEPIGELFRDFPVQPSDSWRSRWLCPDITAFGVLKDQDAALFVEYDGHPRHYEEQGQEADERKTEALLEYAPPGSGLLRISHAARDLRWNVNSMEVVIDTWCAGQGRTLMHVVRQVAQALLSNWGSVLRKDVCERLRSVGATEPVPDLDQASKFTSEAVLTSDIETKKTNVTSFLEHELKLSKKGIRALACKFPRIWGISIEGKLKPIAAWFTEVGLSQKQVAKVVVGFPPVLGYSIDGNLKPTVAWLEDVGLSRKQEVGLTRQQVAKVVAGFPRVLGYSINGNLKPTVAWLQAVGLSQTQVAKVVCLKPQVFGSSIDNNLKPTVAFLEDVGLNRKQVANFVAGFPAVLGCSIDGNLKPTVAWLEDVGLSRQQVTKVVSIKPQVFGYSIENNLSPKHVLLQQFFSKEDICSMIAHLPPMLGLRYTRLPAISRLH